MRVPTMQGVIERRLLINYRLDRDVAATMIPAPFQPQLVNGWAVDGICLIRLGQLRPAVCQHAWASRVRTLLIALPSSGTMRPDCGRACTSRTRHSGAVVNVAVGDRLFPGRHERTSRAPSRMMQLRSHSLLAIRSASSMLPWGCVRSWPTASSSPRPPRPPTFSGLATAVPRSRQPEFGRRENRWPRLNTTGMLC